MRDWRPPLGLTGVLVLVLVAGCGKGPRDGDGEGAGATPTAKESLTNLGDLLKHLEESGKKPPARLADVEPIEPAFPGAYLGLVRGEVVYFWGKPLNPSGSATVLAYEKRAETDGGWVLMQDGKVRQMTAGEFQSAPKAK
jgi:hypothetical protein